MLTFNKYLTSFIHCLLLFHGVRQRWQMWGNLGEEREQATLSSPSANTDKVPVTERCTEELPGVAACNCDQIKSCNVSPQMCCLCCQTQEVQRSLLDHLQVKNIPINCTIKLAWKVICHQRRTVFWSHDVNTLMYRHGNSVLQLYSMPDENHRNLCPAC